MKKIKLENDLRVKDTSSKLIGFRRYDDAMEFAKTLGKFSAVVEINKQFFARSEVQKEGTGKTYKEFYLYYGKDKLPVSDEYLKAIKE